MVIALDDTKHITFCSFCVICKKARKQIPMKFCICVAIWMKKMIYSIPNVRVHRSNSELNIHVYTYFVELCNNQLQKEVFETEVRGVLKIGNLLQGNKYVHTCL